MNLPKSSAIGWKPNHCIFCGKKPEKKSKEHFVPRWLSKLSNADEHPAVIDTRRGVQTIKYGSLTVPACKNCNEEMGKLEEATKPVFERMLSGKIRLEDTAILLDWMDKFRASIWLYMLSAWQGKHAIEPRFSVRNRIGRSDRVVSIARLPDPESSGIGIIGSTTDAFVSSPTVVGLLFRDLAILSWSETAGVSDLFGFSVPGESKEQDGHPLISKHAGTKPLIPNHFALNRLPSIEVFTFAQESAEFHQEFGSNEPYCLDGSGSIRKFPDEMDIPRSTHNKWIARDLFALSVFEQQGRSLRSFPTAALSPLDQLSFRNAKRELDNFIDDALEEVNKQCVFKYQRAVPLLVF